MERRFAPLNIISDNDVYDIQKGTLEVLRVTGVVVEDPVVAKLMGEAGCQVDGDRVRIPEHLVTECLDLCPNSYMVRARDHDNDVHITSGGNTYFMASCGMGIVDLDTWKTRESTRKEFYEAIKVLDYLEHVDLQTAFPYFGFAKLPECMRLIESVAAKLRMSSKAQHEGSTVDEYRWTTAMAKAMDSDVVQIANSASPLCFMKSFTDRLRYLTENDMPLQFAPGPTKGFTSPVTVAGTIISNNAETIAAMVLAQIIKRGTRIWAASMMLTPNMATGLPGFGDIGNGLHDAVFNQVWRAYQIPCTIWSSSWTSAMTIDYQAGYELSMMALISSLSGASVVVSFSGFHAQLAAHPVKSIIDNDVVGMIKRFCRGVDVNKETLAVGLINETGPMPATFIQTPHTFKWWRNECYIPAVASRKSGNRWFQDGAKGTLELAREKMEDILQKHQPKALTDSQEQTLEYILNDARQYYRKNGLINDEDWKLYQEDLSSPNYPYA
jgi:trimethylamine--corrinoid protein Co-methyltransferase